MIDEGGRWNKGGKQHVLNTYLKLHYNFGIGEHPLWVAIERIGNGEREDEVMLDYGYRFERTKCAP